VLITLGIIGVVAALTMPALIVKYQENLLITQFKKVYSVYSQAFQKTLVLDFDGQLACYYPLGSGSPGAISDCDDFMQKFAENIKIIKACENNALAGGCVPAYSDYSSGGCGGFSADSINKLNRVYVVADGSLLMPYRTNTPIFAFDVNGLKGPNKPGHDLFAVAITREDSGAYTFNYVYGNRDENSASILACLPSQGALFSTLSDIYK
jgi:hypothetical protein